MIHTRYFSSRQNIIKLSLFLLLLCNVNLSHAEDALIPKSLKLGVNYSLLDADEKGVLRLDQNGMRNLDFEVNQDLYRIDFGEDQIKEPFTERDVIKKDLKLIIDNIAGGEENTKKPLKLVVNTEAIWAASDPTPRPRKESSETTDEAYEAYASQLEGTAVDEEYYSYLVEYAKILREKNIKWTLSIGHVPPDWIRKEFEETGEDVGDSLPVSPDSKVWRAARPWIEGLIGALKEDNFIGNDKTIEEIFIINEMTFSGNGSISSNEEKKLKSLYLQLRGYVIDSLKKNGIFDVKVSWKFKGDIGAMQNGGLSDETMEDLLPNSNDTTNEDYEITNLIGINFYEGQGLLKDGPGSDRRDAKYACIGSSEEHELQSDTYNVINHYTGEASTLNFDGNIYFTEYGTPNTVSPFKSDELTNCIQYSFDNGVTYWAFYKWNEIRNIKNNANNEIVLGLANAFTRLLYAFPDVPISSKYSEAITELRKMGVLHGNPDGTFRPKKLVNRAEFSKMLVELAENEEIEKEFGEITDEELVKKFPDLKDPWYLVYIGKLKEGVLTLDENGTDYFKGIIHGYDDGLFRPEQTINMAEMLKMIILTFAEAKPNKQDTKWYDQYVNPAMNEIEPIWDENNNEFKSVKTRDEAAILVTREMAAKAMYDAYSTFKK